MGLLKEKDEVAQKEISPELKSKLDELAER